MFNLDRCNGSCNTFDDPFDKHKCKRFSYDNMNKWIKNINKNISCECKCKFEGGNCNSNHAWNNDTWQCECKNLKKHQLRKYGK